MGGERFLIVNADDYGRSAGVNRGVIKAHEDGIVTSASLMVRWPASVEAAACAPAHPSLSVGLHVDLGEWAYQGGDWVAVYEVTPADDRAAVAEEVARQLAAFRRLLGRDPTHLDSHQHAHRREPLRSVLADLARELDIPLRHFSPVVRHHGGFYGQTAQGEAIPEAISVEALVAIVAGLTPGVTELGCHPGEGEDMASVYCRERAWEVTTLCAPRARAALLAYGVTLCSFRSFPRGDR